MNLFRTAIAAFICSSSSMAFAADNYLLHHAIQTVETSAAGVKFSHNPGEGQPSITVTIPGTAGTDCLRMFMYITSLKKEGGIDADGLNFSINIPQKTCSMQTVLIGA